MSEYINSEEPQDVGLPEAAEAERIAAESTELRESAALPSDMRDVADPEGWDVGVPGGIAAGGEMGEGGRDHDPGQGDPWGSDIQPNIEGE